jgi:biopolymer transport protein ExbB
MSLALQLAWCLALVADGDPPQQAAAPAAPAVAADEPMSRLSRSAEQDLQRSIAELTKLREQIANEKLPLANELTTLEDKLSNLRKEHDRVTRLVDEGNLELASIRQLIKEREDEQIYIGNFLDEYARTFETRIHVSELQYCGEPLIRAKQAVEDKTLASTEKFARQIAFVGVSVKRLFDAVGGMRFDGEGVDLQGAVLDGQFAVLGPLALFRSTSGVAGLVVPQAGSTRPLIRPLEGAMQLGLSNLVAQGEGLAPVDPSLGGALRALVQKTNLFHIFEKGGPIMWPLLVASVLALGVVLERVFFLANEKRKQDRHARTRFFAEVEKGDYKSAILTVRGSRDFVVRALSYALEHKERSLPDALLYAQARELKRFQRGIPVLDTVITLAPLLGLLGTVTGMMGSFSLIGGDLSAPGAITGGIAEALIATAFGLGIAITSLLPFNFLNARLNDARHEIESASTQLELLTHQQAAAPHPVAATGGGGGGGGDLSREPVGAGR